MLSQKKKKLLEEPEKLFALLEERGNSESKLVLYSTFVH
jgi:hypothetical protein